MVRLHFGVEDSGTMDVDLTFDGDGIEVEKQGLVGEGEGVALTVELFGLDGVGSINDDVVGHRIGHDTIEVGEAEEVLLVGGIVHTIHRGGGVGQASFEGAVHFVGAVIYRLAGGIALGIDKA